MHARTLLWTLCLTLTAASSAAAADLAVFPVQGTNLSEGELAAIGALLTSACAAQTRQHVLGPSELMPSLVQTQSERDTARALAIKEYIHLEAVRLSSKISLQATLRNQHGSDLYQVRTTALSLDDMEVVADRLAASLLRRTELGNTRGIDSITGKETRGPNRLFLEKILGGRFALVLPVANHLDARPTLQFGFDARLEQADYFLEVGLGFLIDNKASGERSLSAMVGQLGASYYLTHTSVSPYLGLGVSPRIFLGTYSGAGLAVNGHAGLMFMRESSTRLYIELQVGQNLIAAEPRLEYYYGDSSANQIQKPLRNVLATEFSIAAGVGF